jgi:glycosyltransferase involved in cell wall biosynthesis
MRVVYEISALGSGHAHPINRTGTFRVVDSVARGLAASTECDLTFAVTDSVRVYNLCLEYLKREPAFRCIPVLPPVADGSAAQRLGEPIARIDRRACPGLPLRMLRAGLARLLRIVENRSRHLADPGFSGANVFHSPLLPLPTQLGEGKGPQRFLTVHDLIPLLFPNWFEPHVVRRMTRVCQSISPNDWVLCNSYSTKKDLCERVGIDPARVFVTHFAAAPELFHPVTDPERMMAVRSRYGLLDAPYVLSLNTLEPRKNMDHAIRAFAHLVQQERVRDLQFVLVGTRGWYYQKILEALAETGVVRDRIILTGYVADEDLAALYSGALAFVYPSRYEGFGLPPLEAMQCGVPVITSNTSSLPEVVGEAGIMLDPDDEDGLSHAILQVYRDGSLGESMRAKSLARAAQFSWQRCTRETVAAYRAALDS